MQANMPHRKEARSLVAKQCAEARAKRTAQQQLELLDQRGFRAERERARLLKQITE